jgi:hypothetical protein
MADTNPQFIRLGLRRRGRSTRLRMRWDRSPLTCATVASMLPVEEQVYHAKYANNEIYNLLPLPKPKPPQEWACLYPGPGDLLFAPVSSRLTGSFAGGNTLSEQKLEVDEEGWLLDFAFFYERGNSLISPYGIGPSTLFATGTSFEELEDFADACRDVWFAGAVGETMYIEPA